MQTTLLLFGTFELAINGIAVSHIPTDKARALLAYLAIEPERPHRREYLAGLLWSDVPQDVALKNLRQSLYRLRQTLDRTVEGATDRILRVSQQTIGLDSTTVFVDVHQLQRALVESERHSHLNLASCPECLAKLRRAMELYRGELLAGFSLSDAPAFEEWLMLRREMLHQQVLLTLNHVGSAHEANGEYGEAHQLAARQLAMDPYREEAHRQIIRLLALHGSPHQALAHYESCRRLLHDELGVEPEDETVGLAKQIAMGKFPDPRTPAVGALQQPAGAEPARPPQPEPNSQAAARSLPIPSNLPWLPITLLGREQELATITRGLTNKGYRLITLIGPGGVGKTSLAIQAARSLQDHFTGGICFVDLGMLLDPNLVAVSIAQALNIHESGAVPMLTRIKEALRDKHFLLVIDNFEQVITAAQQLAELLSSCPQLRIMVTSRRVLHLRAEQTITVGPLPLPPRHAQPDPTTLLQYSAIAFFVQRAQAALPNFKLTPDNATAVAELCIWLDGLPLAIELVAARLRILPPQALLARLKGMSGVRLNLLTSSMQDRPQHKQTLQQTIDWSYQLLEPNLKTLFVRLAIFVGGCTVEAVEAVCSELLSPQTTQDLTHGTGVPSQQRVGTHILDDLVSLMDQSLLYQQIGADGELRLLMMETIREYAQEHLYASAELEQVQQRHIAYYSVLAAETGLLTDRANMVSRMQRLEAEHGNLQAALTWSMEVMHNSDDTLRLAHTLGSFWYYRGYWREGRQLLERALAITSAEAGTSLRAEVGLRLAELAFGQGDFTVARTWLARSLVDFRQIGDPNGIASSLSVLGLVVREQGDAVQASAIMQESLALFRAQDAQVSIPWTLCSLGEILVMQGNPEQARPMLEEALQLFRSQREPLGIGWAYNHLGHVAQLEQDYPRALTWHEASLPQFRDRDRNGMAWALCNLGQIFQAQGDLTLAKSRYSASLELFLELGSRQGIAWCLAGVAGLACTAGHPDRAAWLWGAVHTLRTIEPGRPAPGNIGYEEQAVAAARTQLSPVAFSQAWTAGESASLDEVLAYIRETGDFIP